MSKLGKNEREGSAASRESMATSIRSLMSTPTFRCDPNAPHDLSWPLVAGRAVGDLYLGIGVLRVRDTPSRTEEKREPLTPEECLSTSHKV